MGQLGARIAQVTVQSDWLSKINWTQVVAWVCSAITVFAGDKWELEAATQASIVLTIQSLAAIVTIWLRRYTTSITPTAAAKLAGK